MYINSGDPPNLYFHIFVIGLRVPQRRDPSCIQGWAVGSSLSYSYLPHLGQSVARAYELLSSMYFSKGIKMWKMMPKVHLFEHLTEYQVPYWTLNPKTFWTYQDEDLVGEVVLAATQCHPRTMCEVLLYKWILQKFDSDVLNDLDE